MKNYILAALSILGFFTTQTQASECQFKEVPLSGSVYVVPVYKADANFIFNKSEKSAYALVTWGLDEDATKNCFAEGKNKFPQARLFIPTVRMDDLTLHVMKGEKSRPLQVIQLANGHWQGMADIIMIPYNARSEFVRAIQSGERVISITGDIRYRMTEVERKIVGKIDCIKKNEEAGVLNLFRRFGEIKTALDKRDQKEAINVEEVMQEFLGTCVIFQNVEADNFLDFDKAQKINSRIVRGNLYLKGNVATETTASLPTIAIQNASILDL